MIKVSGLLYLQFGREFHFCDPNRHVIRIFTEKMDKPFDEIIRFLRFNLSSFGMQARYLFNSSLE